MEIKLNQRELLEGLKKLKAVNRKNMKLPILEGVNLVVDEDSVVLKANNLNVEVNCKLYDFNIVETGSCIIPAATIKILEKIKDGETIITKDKIQVETKKIKYISQDASEFVTYSKEKFNNEIMSITEQEFTRLMRVSEFVAKDDTRPILQSVNIRKNRFCALDGFKLAISESNAFMLNKNELNINADAIHTLNKILDKKSKNEIKFYLNENKDLLKIEFENFNVISKLAEGEFMKYESLIPSAYNTVTLQEKEIEKAIDILKFAKEFKVDNKNIIHLNVLKDKMMFKTTSLENSYQDEIEIENNCDKLEITFNAEYLEKGIKWINNNSNIEMNYISRFNPVLFKNELNDICLVVPMRYNKEIVWE